MITLKKSFIIHSLGLSGDFGKSKISKFVKFIWDSNLSELDKRTIFSFLQTNKINFGKLLKDKSFFKKYKIQPIKIENKISAINKFVIITKKAKEEKKYFNNCFKHFLSKSDFNKEDLAKLNNKAFENSDFVVFNNEFCFCLKLHAVGEKIPRGANEYSLRNNPYKDNNDVFVYWTTFISIFPLNKRTSDILRLKVLLSKQIVDCCFLNDKNGF